MYSSQPANAKGPLDWHRQKFSMCQYSDIALEGGLDMRRERKVVLNLLPHWLYLNDCPHWSRSRGVLFAFSKMGGKI